MRNPWEIDWNDPQQAQAQQHSQRPRIQGPPRQPPPRYEDEAARSAFDVQRAPYQVQREQIGVTNDSLAAEQRRRELARLPDNIQQTLARDVDSFSAFDRAVNNFTDDYSGLGSGVENYFQERLGTGTEGQRQWWADFRAADNAIRNQLFGASLSEGERAAFQATTISPNMTPAEVRRNLEARRVHAREALGRRIQSLRAQGYDENALGALLGDYQDILNPEAPAREGSGPPPSVGDSPTTTPQRTMAPGAGGQMELSTETETRSNPALAGLNTRVGQMIQQQRPIGTIVSYLRERGVSGPNLQALSSEIRRIRAWQRQNPNYRGPITVDLERYDVPLGPVTSALGSAADTGPGAAVGSYIDTLTGRRLDNIAGALGGDTETVNAGIEEIRNRHPLASIGGDVAAGASLYGAGRAVAGRALGGALPTTARTFGPGAVAGDAAMGAYIGSGSGTDLFSPEGAALGAAAGVGGGALGRGAINTLGRAVSPTGGRMAPLYAEGVQPTLGQRIGGAADRFEQATTSVPFLGGLPRRARNQAIEQFQRGAFNQSLREIGQELPRNVPVGTAAQRFMQRAFNREFEQIRGQMRFAPDNEFGQSYGQIINDVGQLRTDSQNAFRSLVERDLGARLRSSGGSLQGDAYVRVTSRLSARARAIRRNPSGDHELADAYERLGEALDDAAARNSAPEIAARLTAARRGYQKAVVIEDAARRRGSGTGLFSPTQFDAAVQNIGGGLRSRSYLRGEAPMQDYAEAGLNLGDTLANSGTTDRILASGAIGTAGWASPWTLAPLAASLGANAPGVRQGINMALAPNRPGMMGLRSQIQDRAYLGSLAGLPLIPQQ